MPVAVLYPKVSLEMSSGTIARWLVKEGDTVARGQVLFEIDNDKAAVEVEAPASGTMTGMVSAETEIEVGAAVAQILTAGENIVSAPSLPSPRNFAAPAATPSQGVAAPPAAAGDRRSAQGPRATPLARRIARDHGISFDGMVGTGPRNRIQKKDVLERLSAGAAQTPAAAQELNAVWLRRGTGMPVVMLHGFSGDLNNWRGMLAGAPVDWPVLAMDLPGHGQSPRDVPGDIDAMAELVEATLKKHAVGALLLVGHSVGGALAARVAVRGHADVRGLCLFAPAGLGPQINADFLDGILRARRTESLRPWLELLVHDPALIPEAMVKAVALQREDEALNDAMEGFRERFLPDGTQAISSRADLAQLQMPVRVVFGRQDSILPFTATRTLPGHVALHALDGCGHMPHLEHPALARRIVEDMHRACRAEAAALV